MVSELVNRSEEVVTNNSREEGTRDTLVEDIVPVCILEEQMRLDLLCIRFTRS